MEERILSIFIAIHEHQRTTMRFFSGDFARSVLGQCYKEEPLPVQCSVFLCRVAAVFGFFLPLSHTHYVTYAHTPASCHSQMTSSPEKYLTRNLRLTADDNGCGLLT